MLPRVNRLRRSSDFARASRHGATARRGGIIAHVLYRPAVPVPEAPGSTRIGLVVGRNLGGSVERHRLSRQLRAIAVPLLDEIPAGLDVVIRPTQPSAVMSYGELAVDMRAAVQAACRKAVGDASGSGVRQT